MRLQSENEPQGEEATHTNPSHGSLATRTEPKLVPPSQRLAMNQYKFVTKPLPPSLTRSRSPRSARSPQDFGTCGRGASPSHLLSIPRAPVGAELFPSLHPLIPLPIPDQVVFSRAFSPLPFGREGNFSFYSFLISVTLFLVPFCVFNFSPLIGSNGESRGLFHFTKRVRRKEKDLAARFCHICRRLTSSADFGHVDGFGSFRLGF